MKIEKAYRRDRKIKQRRQNSRLVPPDLRNTDASDKDRPDYRRETVYKEAIRNKLIDDIYREEEDE